MSALSIINLQHLFISWIRGFIPSLWSVPPGKHVPAWSCVDDSGMFAKFHLDTVPEVTMVSVKHSLWFPVSSSLERSHNKEKYSSLQHRAIAFIRILCASMEPWSLAPVKLVTLKDAPIQAIIRTEDEPLNYRQFCNKNGKLKTWANKKFSSTHRLWFRHKATRIPW